MTAREFLLTDPKIEEAVSQGYDIRLSEQEWLTKMEEYSKFIQSNKPAREVGLFSKKDVIELITRSWIKEYKNLNNDPNTGQVNAAGYFLLGFVSSALEEASTGNKNFKAPTKF